MGTPATPSRGTRSVHGTSGTPDDLVGVVVTVPFDADDDAGRDVLALAAVSAEDLWTLSGKEGTAFLRAVKVGGWTPLPAASPAPAPAVSLFPVPTCSPLLSNW